MDMVINTASISIDAAFYDFNRPAIRDALIAAHNRGLTLHIVTDDDARANATYAPFFQSLVAAGIPLIDDQRPGSLMHNKYFIIDHRLIWTGSTNMSATDFTLNHNNALVLTSTLAAQVYQHDFDQLWAGHFSTAKTASLTTTLTYNAHPLEIYFSPQDNALAHLVDQVNAATATIDFAIFFFTDPTLRDALLAAHNRGVIIRGLWDELSAGQGESPDETLCAAGIPIKIENTAGKMHNKFIVIDANQTTATVVTGSMNWSSAGANRNDENTLILHDPILAHQYATAFQTMWDFLTPATQCPLIPTGALYLPLITNGPLPQPTAPTLRIAKIVYDPPGADLVGEYIQLYNSGATAQDLTNWQLTDLAHHAYPFPSFALQPLATVTLWTKSGVNTPTDLYWNSGMAIWNNDGDTAILTDANNTTIDTCTYPGGGQETTCVTNSARE